jgi:hypothetical protein
MKQRAPFEASGSLRSFFVVPALLLAFAGGCVAESAAGLKWSAPTGWHSEGSAPFRVVTYSISPRDNSGKAECIVYFFGPGQGGTVQANLDRWSGQFTRGGKPAPANPRTRTIHGIQVTTIDLTGTYTATGGQARDGQQPLPGYRMLAAIAQGPQGNIFIRLIGPEKTVTAELAAYEKLLLSLEPGS